MYRRQGAPGRLLSKPAGLSRSPGAQSFKLAVREDAGPVLLEPIYDDARRGARGPSLGDVLGDLNTRLGDATEGIHTERGRTQRLTAQVPHAGDPALHHRPALDHRRARCLHDDDSHHEVVPAHVAEQIIAARQKDVWAIRSRVAWT